MATGCSRLGAFDFTSEPLGRKHAVGVSRSSELSRVSAPTHKHPTGMPDGPPFDEQLLLDSLFGREDSCRWEGARWLGVWDATGSARRSLMGVGAVRRIRTAPIQQTNNWPKKIPPSGETKAGIVGCVGSIRLWSLTLRLWWDGLTNSALHAFPESTCLRAVLRWRIWLTPLKGERRRQKIRLWHAANLTCVNSLIPTFQYRAEVCGTVGREQQMGKLVTTLIIEPRSLVWQAPPQALAAPLAAQICRPASTSTRLSAQLRWNGRRRGHTTSPAIARKVRLR
jgi:hypothetical protein